MENLVLLKRIACDYNVLIVEDSKHIVIKLKEFLQKFFLEIDIAYDGKEALEKFKDKSYDIVLTDINMPKLDGNALVQELLKLDPKIQIIVISAFGYDENMVTFNKYGIVEFIQKPINNIQLVDSLIKSIENIKLIKNEDKKVSFTLDDEMFQKIQEHKKSNKNIELINFYKGVSISQIGTLKDINQNTITVETGSNQYYLIKCEKRTVVLVDDLVLKTELQYEDKAKEQLILKKFEQLHRSPKEREVTRVAPDKFFTLSRLYKGENFTFDVIAVSVNSISVKTSYMDECFFSDESIDLIIGFKLSSEAAFQEEKIENIKVKCKAHIFRVNELDKNNKKVVFMLILDNENKKLMEEYILQRETQILSQLQSINTDLL